MRCEFRGGGEIHKKRTIYERDSGVSVDPKKEPNNKKKKRKSK